MLTILMLGFGLKTKWLAPGIESAQIAGAEGTTVFIDREVKRRARILKSF